MTNRPSFEWENIGHTCYIVVDAWFNNFCHGFINPFAIFSSKMKSLQQTAKSFENQGRKVRKNGG